MNNQLLDFYRGESADVEGWFIAHIWGWDNERLESNHTYIQWLFPSAKPSQYNKNSPLLDPETVEAFSSDDELRLRLRKSFKLMLRFYGLRLRDGSTPVVIKAVTNYEQRKATWQDAPEGYINHNLLRLTRIMEALAVLGWPEYSRALCQCLSEIQAEEPTKIPAKTLHFWKVAAGLAG